MYKRVTPSLVWVASEGEEAVGLSSGRWSSVQLVFAGSKVDLLLLIKFLKVDEAKLTGGTTIVLCSLLPSIYSAGCKGYWRSHGLNSALAGKGVLVLDQVRYKDRIVDKYTKDRNVDGADGIGKSYILVPLNIPEMNCKESSKGEKKLGRKKVFNRVGLEVTSHISSISNIYVHDGAIGPRSTCNVNIRMISDGPSSVLAFSNIIWETSSRAISKDSCPLTVYAAESISPGVSNSIGLGTEGDNGFIAADIERSMLIVCGTAFSDINRTKETLVALSEPVIFARGGLPLPGRLLVFGDSVVLLFAPEDIIQSCAVFLISRDAGVILSSEGVMPFFRFGDTNTNGPNLYKLPSAIVLITSDDSRTIPSASKLSPGQAAYHFLAGHQNGKFVPAFHKGPSSIDPLELAKALMFVLKEQQIPSFLVNAKGIESGKELVTLVESTLSMNIPPFRAKGGEIKRRYKSFLSGKYQQLPEGQWQACVCMEIDKIFRWELTIVA
ncbi:uncharacterized protein E5676_scaffold1293G00230 [Cucumis melo var. makuwa]|uniref:phosphoenolpyruvate carboxykinase (ATP) n=1 Tax=Cucumis melo var. makuwa TaxID=1194695 RepID=A0A5D3DBF6_CUCMM|nr:uncharacterized protein E5676_scaffold1293G00230 [Cucumis melo var. makuwa]